jgi:hypothetical protein
MTQPKAPVRQAAETLPDAAVKEESARYALMRRVAPAVRHHMAGSLQPIGMVSAIMERRLQADTPDLAVLRESGKSISTLSRSAAQACMGLITWVAPKEHGVVALQTGVEECLGMLTTDLAFRGFKLINQVDASGMAVPVLAVRTVFTACLIALTDAARAPANVLVGSEVADGQARLRISLSSGKGATPAGDPRAYRKLGWDDVAALAAAEQVSVKHSAKQVDMVFNEAPQADLLV